MAAASPHRFDHLVVIMFENRSFDNLLGYLYPPREGRNFEGVLERTLSNPIPKGLDGAERESVPVHPATSLDTPDPDPGEEFPHVNTQLFGTVSPPSNRLQRIPEMQAPFNAPPAPAPVPAMQGFVADYVNAFQVEMGRLPTYDEYSQIMACYTPDQLPVLAGLARGFACFDHWFCEVPSQTFTNRSFFHAGSSSGFVLDFPVENFVVGNDAPTIFERLEQAKVPWKVYIDPDQVVSVTGLIHARRLAPYFSTRFASIYDFFAEAQAGTLPAYAFIEPNLLYPRSDMHPPEFGRLRHELHLPAPPAIQRGDRLLARVYGAVRRSSNPSGSNWRNTLLVVTFDEHGGTYDHVPPPAAPAPTVGAPAGQMGFTFERSGVRIPTLLISAWVDAGTVVNSEFRSTSVLRTLRERWNLGDPLTRRDAIAPDLGILLTRDTPRPPEEWPEFAETSVPLASGLTNLLDAPLEGLGKHLLAAALAHETRTTGRATTVDSSAVTRRTAKDHLHGLRATVFPGVRDGRRE